MYTLTHHLLQILTRIGKEHGFNFDPQEDAKRFRIFAQADKFINEHNAQNYSYQLGHNQFSHLTSEEFSATQLGLIHEGNPHTTSKTKIYQLNR